MLLARDVGGDLPVGESRVDFLPGLVRVGDELAVLRHLGGQRQVDVLRLEAEVGALGVGGEDDAVIAELDFDDVLDAVLGLQSSISSVLILRDALAMSMVSSPTPLQNCLMPAPEPPDSTTGLEVVPALPNCSATILA